MKRLFASLLILSLSWQAAAAMELSLPVTTDYKAAIKQAADNDKTVFLLFSMTSCGHCQALKKKVLSTEAFQDFANESLVVVAYDYQKRRELSAGDRAQMKALMEAHEISGFPAILLLNPEGEVLLKSSGYGGSPADTVIKLFKERIGAQSTAL